jgi:His-Xaa-Ser system protein HxsD
MTEVLVEFNRSTYTIEALREAAYRIIRHSSCQIEIDGDRYLCRLTPKPGPGVASLDEPELRAKFVDLVTDEILREKIAAQTSGIRDVIVALAFGALAVGREDAGSA